MTARLRRRCDLAAAALVLAVVVVSGALSAGPLAYPHSGDEYAYVYQAQTFLAGRLANPHYPARGHVPFWCAVSPLGVFSKYPPGYPLLLTAGVALGFPGLVNALLGGVCVALTYLLGRRALGPPAGLAAAALLASSAFFLLNASSAYSHVASAALFLVALHAAWRLEETGATRQLVVLSAALGGMFLVRPFSAALVGLSFAVFLASREFRAALVGRRGLGLGIAVLPLGAAVALYLVYNRFTTGDPLVPGHVFIDRTDIVKHTSPELATLGQYFRELAALTAHPILYLAPPLIALALRGFALGRVRAGHAVVLTLLLWLVHALRDPMFPPHYGPRYTFESLPLLCLVLAGVAFHVSRRRPIFAAAAVALIVGQQTWTTVRAVREVSFVLFQAQTLQRAADEIASGANAPMTVVVAGPSGEVPTIDLARNGVRFDEQRVRFVRVRGEPAPLRVDPATLYLWDGHGPMPLLVAAAPAARPDALFLDRGVMRRVEIEASPAWLLSTADNTCVHEERVIPGLRGPSLDRRDQWYCDPARTSAELVPGTVLSRELPGGQAVVARAILGPDDPWTKLTISTSGQVEVAAVERNGDVRRVGRWPALPYGTSVAIPSQRSRTRLLVVRVVDRDGGRLKLELGR